MKSGSLKPLEPSVPVQGLLYLYHFSIHLNNRPFYQIYYHILQNFYVKHVSFSYMSDYIFLIMHFYKYGVKLA